MLFLVLDWSLYIFGLVPLSASLLLLYKFKLKPKPVKKLQKTDWEKDVVYLCQFPLCPSVRTISPFALKLETWLRLAGIKYENVFTMKFGSKGQIPYIELNGEEIPDSNIIISRLKSHFGKDPDDACSPQDLAIGHAVTGLVEHHLAHVGFHYRYGLHMPDFLSKLKLGEYYNLPRAMNNWGRFQPTMTKVRSYLQGIGRHTESEIWEMSFKDLKAISDLLNNKDYLLGKSPTTVDCVLFGHLAQFLFIDIGFPQKTYLEQNCPNLVSLVEKMKSDFWPEWDEEIELAKKERLDSTK